MADSRRFDGRSIVVTGGGHGIGRAYCERLAREGARVACLDIDGEAADRVARSIVERGGTCLSLKADVSIMAAVERAISQVADAFGEIEGIVNNAGMLNVVPISRVLFEAISEEEWDRVFAVNAKGVWNCCKAVVPYLRQRGGGSIVNISSSTFFKANPTRAHYVAAKSAVIGLSRVLSRELGGDSIRVNVVCPGSTLSEESPDAEVVRMREEPIATRSLKRVQVPEDVVGAVLFLLSDDSAFITGQTIVVEGGAVLH